MKLYIKFMVSLRCKLFVTNELTDMGVNQFEVSLGSVEIKQNMTPELVADFQARLEKGGLELLDDKNAILVERIKNVIVEMIHYDEDLPRVNFSTFLSEKLHQNYSYMATIFSQTKGTTIEHYIMLHKIEKVKELLLYNELTISQIAYKLHYSSAAHLSNQFKKITGLTPTFFKNMAHLKRKGLEEL
jgi:AraC-like DNA-binding protein